MASIVGLVPKFKNQGDYAWDQIEAVLRTPEKYSFDDIIDELKNKIFSGIFSIFWDDNERDKQRRQCIWILCVLLFHEGWDNLQNRKRVLNIMHEWEIDQAIFYEMQDTAETYRVLSQAHVDDWDVERKKEFKRNRSDLDKSINDLIELG